MPLLFVEYLGLNPMRFLDGVECGYNLLAPHTAQTLTNLLIVLLFKFALLVQNNTLET